MLKTQAKTKCQRFTGMCCNLKLRSQKEIYRAHFEKAGKKGLSGPLLKID